MITIDPRASQKLQSELISGESIHWAAMPNPSVIFHSDDLTLIPFSLAWTGFIVFWEAQVLGYGPSNAHKNGGNLFRVLWGIPFLVLGNYMLWGRFLYDAWLKRRTYYAVTNRRVMILQEGWKQKTSMSFLEDIPQIEKEGRASGTLWFGTKYPVMGARGQKKRDMSRFSLGDVPVFADIEDADSVYRLILELRAKTTSRPFSEPALTYSPKS